MKHILSILFLAITNILLAQNKQLHVVDSLTQMPIAGVELQSGKSIVVSNAQGVFNLGKLTQESFTINHDCCFEKKVRYHDGMDTIYLQRKPQLIEEITINSDFTHPLSELGYYNMRKKKKLNGSLSNSSVLVVFMPYSKENTYINRILLDINSRQSAANYGVKLYEADSTGMPGKLIYQQKIEVGTLKKEGIIEVRDEQLTIPENGLYIGLENFISTQAGEQSEIGVKFHYTEAIDSSRTYITLNSKQTNAETIWIPIESFSGNKMTPFFSLEVYQK